MALIELTPEEREALLYVLGWEDPDPDFEEERAERWSEVLEGLTEEGPIAVSPETLEIFDNMLYWFSPDPDWAEARGEALFAQLEGIRDRIDTAIRPREVVR